MKIRQERVGEIKPMGPCGNRESTFRDVVTLECVDRKRTSDSVGTEGQVEEGGSGRKSHRKGPRTGT